MTTPMQGTRARVSPFAREIDEDLENLRDDCIALFLNSGLRQVDITAAGGPTPSTITKWLYKETRFPRYQTIAAFLRVLGSKLIVVNKDILPVADLDPGVRDKVAWQGRSRPVMPARKARRSARSYIKSRSQKGRT